MINKFKEVMDDSGMTVEKLYATSNTVLPKHGDCEMPQTFVVAQLFDGLFIHMIHTYNNWGTALVFYAYVSLIKDDEFDFSRIMSNDESSSDIRELLEENEINFHELAAEIIEENNRPLPACSIKGIHIRFKLNGVIIPEYMEYSELENQETRFVMENEMQHKWLSSLINVDIKYLREFEYITLYV